MKPKPFGHDADGNSELASNSSHPKSWATASIKRLCAVDVGFAFRSEEYATEGIRLLRGENIEPGSLRWRDVRFWPKAKLGGFRHLLIEEGDVVLAMDRPIISSGLKLATAKATDVPCLLVQRMARFRSVEPVILKYVYYNFQTTAFRAHLVKGQTGTQLPHVSTKSILAYELPLAPLAEQRRIVSAIESNLSRVDAGVAEIKRAQSKLKRYRAAVLKAACEGRLVPTEAELARGAKGRDFEPADRLLARVRQERRERWESDQLAKMSVRAVKPTGEAWKAKYHEPAGPAVADQDVLPEGWSKATVEQVTAVVQYGTSSKTSEVPDGVAVLRMGNIVEGRISTDDLKYLPSDHDDLPALILEAGDLLFNRTNSAELVGKSAVFRGYPSPCSFASYLIRVRLVPGVAPDFLAYYLNSAAGRSWIASVATQQVGQANVNGTKLQALVIPIPPSAEQTRIVAEVERRLSLIDGLEAAIAANMKRANRLRQSILKRAFEGKLVPQDPADEPAESLLARIGRAKDGASRLLPGM